MSLLICMGAVSAFAENNKTLGWSLALQNLKSGEMLPFQTPVKSSSGERYRLIIVPQTNCFYYIIVEEANGNMAVYSTGALKGGETWQSPTFQLTAPSGTETLFVITSLKEQKDLVKRISDFSKNPGVTQRRGLMDELNRLRSQVSKFKETPEKPVLMGGTIRRKDKEDMGVAFSGQDIYVKTISIEH